MTKPLNIFTNNNKYRLFEIGSDRLLSVCIMELIDTNSSISWFIAVKFCYICKYYSI